MNKKLVFLVAVLFAALSSTFAAVPTITSITPNTGTVAGGTIIHLAGANYISGTSNTVTVNGLSCTNSAGSTTNDSCYTPASATAGAFSVVISNSNGTSTASTFTYLPQVLWVSPSTVPTAGGTLDTIHGTGFTSGATVTIGGSTCTSPTVISSTQISCTTPAIATAGGKNVIVTENSESNAAALVLKYTADAAPTITSLSVSTGPDSGGTSVTLTGTGFNATGNVGSRILFGSMMCAGPITYTSSTSLTCTATPANLSGPVNVSVYNADGLVGTLTNGFTYTNSSTTGNYTTWNRYKTMALNTSSMTLSGPVVSNVPVLLQFSATNEPDMFNASAGPTVVQANGQDLRITKADGVTNVPFQVLSWTTGASGTGQVWVLLDSVVANSSNAYSIRIYWGSSNASQTTMSNGAAVFNKKNGFLGVWHLNETSGNAAEASGSGYNATASSTAPTAYSGGATSPLPGGRTFNGTSSYFYMATPGSGPNNGITSASYYTFGLHAANTISAWVLTSQTTNGGIISHGNDDWQLQVQTAANGGSNMGNAVGGLMDYADWGSSTTFQNANEFNPLYSAGVWHHIVGVRNVKSPWLQLYIDGALAADMDGTSASSVALDDSGTSTGIGTVKTGSGSTATTALSLGIVPTGTVPPGTGGFFNGSMVEATVSNQARSSDWINLSFNTECINGTTPNCPVSSPMTIQGQGGGAGPTLSYSGTPFTFGTQNSVGTISPTVTGSPTSYSISPALSGNGTLAFNTSSGVITGTPSAAVSATTYTVTATNSNGSAQTQISITVAGPVITAQPQNATPVSGGSTSFSVTASSPDASTLTYQWFQGATSLTNTGEFSGTTTATLTVNPVSASDTGLYSVVVTNDQGSLTSSNAHLVLALVPSFTGYSTPVHYVAGQAITSNNPTVLGNPTACTATPTLPVGLTISPTTCVISGIPTKVSPLTSYDVHASNAAGSKDTLVSVQVYDTLPTITLALPTKTQTTVGASGGSLYAKVGINGGGDTLYRYTWYRRYKVSGTPTTSIVQIDSNSSSLVDSMFFPNGVGSTVTAAYDSSRYFVAVQNLDTGADSSSFDTLYVAPIISYSPDTVALGKSIVSSIPAINSGGSITSCTAPGLPTGLTINTTTCAITGTPSVATAAANYTVTASGPGGGPVTATPNIAVLNAPTSLNYTGVSVYDENDSVTVTPTALGTAPFTPVIYHLTSGTLPAGLSLDSVAGNIKGTIQTGAGSVSGSPYSVTITDSNAAGIITSAAVNFTVFSTENYSSWTNNQTMLLNSTAAGISTSQSNFPLLVRLTASNFGGSTNFTTAGTMSTLRFARGTQHLKYQVEQWDSSGSTNTAAIWVKLDSVAASGTTPVTMYWTTPGPTILSHSNGPAVFNTTNGFAAAYHLDEPTLSTASVDASPYASPANWFGSSLKPTSTSGVIGNALNFANLASTSNTGAYLTTSYNLTNNNLKLTQGNGMTLSAWVNRTAVNNATNNAAGMVSLWRYTTTSHKEAELRNTNATNLVFGAAYNSTGAATDTVVSSTATLGNGTWFHVVGTFVDGAQKLYVNGVSVGTSQTSSHLPSFDSSWVNNALTIGKSDSSDVTNKQYFYGSIDEVEMAKTARSADWINLSYKSQKIGVTPVFNFSYPQATPTYVVGTPISTDSPTVAGSGTRFTISGTGVTNPATFHSTTGLTFDSTTGKITGTPNAALSSAAYTVTAYSDSAWSTTGTVTITANSPPVVTSNPTGQVVNQGANVKFGVTVTGTEPITYKWIHNHGGSHDTIQSDLNESSLTDTLALTSVPLSDTGSYSVYITNVAGNATSTSATLGIQAAPTIASNPMGQSANAGNTVKFGVVLNAGTTTPIVYTWILHQNGTPDTVHKDTLSVLTDTLTLASVPVSDSGSYTVYVTNVVGNVTSSSAYLSLGAPPTISSNPSSKSANIGTTVKFGVSVTSGANTPLVYKWLLTQGGITDTLRKDTLSVLTDTLTLSNIPLSDTGTYSVYVCNSSGNITSSSATLTITAATFIYPTPTAIFGKRIPIATDSPSVSGAITKFTVSPALPAGLVLDSVTGKITGTPNVSSATANYGVTGTNGPLSSTDSVSITVNGFSYVTNHPALFGKNVAASPDSLKNVIGTFTAFAVSPALPAGLSLNTTTGILTGTPTVAAAAAKYAVTGTYSGGTAVDTLNLTVLGFTYATQPATFLNGNLIAPDSAQVTVGPLSHYAVSPALPAGLVLDTNLGTVSGTPSATQAAANYVVTASDSGKASTVDTLSITVNALPVIASSPSSQVVNQGTTAKFEVSVTSGATTPLVYTWVRNQSGVPDTLRKDTLSALTDTLVLASVPLSDTGSYLAVVSNVSGKITSASATLGINAIPVISSSPAGKIRRAGVNTKFGVTVTGTTPLVYTWVRNQGGVPDTLRKDTLSVLTDSLTVDTLVAADTGSYLAVVSNVAGSVTSASATLSIITSEPQNIMANAGATVKFGVTVVGSGPFTYEWVKGASDTLSGQILDTLTLSGIAITDTGAYKALVTNASGTAASTSAELQLNVVPTIASSPAVQSANVGGTAKFGVSVTAGTTTPLVYTWVLHQNGAADTLRKDTLSLLTDTLVLASIPLSDTGSYSAVVSNVAGSVTSGSAALVVNTAPALASNPSGQSVVLGATVKFGVSVNPGVTTPLVYAWLHSHGGVTDTLRKDTLSVLTDSLTLASVPLADTGSYKAVVTNVAGSVTSSSATLTILVAPTFTYTSPVVYGKRVTISPNTPSITVK